MKRRSFLQAIGAVAVSPVGLLRGVETDGWPSGEGPAEYDSIEPKLVKGKLLPLVAASGEHFCVASAKWVIAVTAVANGEWWSASFSYDSKSEAESASWKLRSGIHPDTGESLWSHLPGELKCQA